MATSNMNSNNVSVLLGEAATASPATPSAGGVVNAASLLDGVAAGTWITIFGSNLSTTTRSWAAADFNGNKQHEQQQRERAVGRGGDGKPGNWVRRRRRQCG